MIADAKKKIGQPFGLPDYFSYQQQCRKAFNLNILKKVLLKIGQRIYNMIDRIG